MSSMFLASVGQCVAYIVITILLSYLYSFLMKLSSVDTNTVARQYMNGKWWINAAAMPTLVATLLVIWWTLRSAYLLIW